MRILCTGPESSGTNYLTKLIAAGGADALHRSQPEGVDWIDLEAMLDDFDEIVIVIRGRLAHLHSTVKHYMEPDHAGADRRRRKSMSRLAPILGHEKVTVVTYESLRHLAERRHLLASLGLDPAGAERTPFDEQNAKHYQ